MYASSRFGRVTDDYFKGVPHWAGVPGHRPAFSVEHFVVVIHR